MDSSAPPAQGQMQNYFSQCNFSQNSSNSRFLSSNFPSYILKQAQLCHPPNIFCLHNCSVWIMTLNSQLSKKVYPQSPVFGKIVNQPNPLNASLQILPQNIFDYLPIDLVANQRFVLDQNQPKENLNIQFDFSKISSNFSVINKNYSSMTFEFNLYANLHGINMLKAPINFKVKGYDILKSIQIKLSEINDSTSTTSQTSGSRTYITTVFTNLQCSFTIEFSVSNLNIAKYISSSSQYMNFNIGLCEIRISRLIITYCLPLTVFSFRNLKRQPAYYTPNQQQQFLQFQRLMLLKNPNALPRTTFSQLLQRDRNKANFCNWYSFMTSTTPFLIEKESVNIFFDVLSCFKKAALFGVKCTFRVEKEKYTQVNYFPSISSVSIVLPENLSGSVAERSSINSIHSLSNTSTKQPKQKENLSLNGSFQTNVSESAVLNLSNISNMSGSGLRTIKYKEKKAELYNMKGFSEQLKEILSSEPSLATLQLKDVTQESWFSITWSPLSTFQASKKEGVDFIPSPPMPIFKVFYQFHQGEISNKGKFITVIGVVQKTIKGKSISVSNEQNDNFWLRNNNNYENEENFEYNRDLFYSLVDQARLIEV